MPEFDTLIAGNGYTGKRLLAALPAARAVAISRSAGSTVNGNPVRVVDLDEPSGRPLPVPARSVIYAVPPAHVAGRDPRLGRFLDALPEIPARFVYFSTTGVYGDCNGQTVDETSRPNPSSDRARRRFDAEQRLTEWSTVSGTSLVILRVPGIYGPGRLGLERLQDGMPFLCEGDAGPGNRIHVDDLVRCAIAASESVPGGIYNVGDGDHRSATWFARTVASLAGLPPPRQVSRQEAERDFSPRRLSFLKESRRVDTRRMRGTLNVTPIYGDAAAGISASLTRNG